MSIESPPSAPTATLSLSADIPFKRDSDSTGGASSGLLAFGLLAVLVAALVVAFVVKRRKADRTPGTTDWRSLLGAVAQSGGIERLGSTRLTARHSLHVIRWEGRKLLVGCTADSMQVLAQSAEASSTSNTRGAP